MSDVLAHAVRAHEKSRARCATLERRTRAALREDPRRFGRATEALFDLVAESDLLPRVAPRGRVGADFATRCLAAAARWRTVLASEKEALRIATSLASRTASGAEAREHVHRGDAGGPADSGQVRLSRAVIKRLATLAASFPGEPEEGLGPGELAIPGTALVVDRRGNLRARPLVPGSNIVVGRPLISGRLALRVSRPRRAGMRVRRGVPVRDSGETRRRSARVRSRGPDESALDAARLGRALDILQAVWPEAAEEVRARTRLVLPLAEPGLVSFSLPSRPGVSFINLRGKTLTDLADDMLHEAAHHRLHAVEERTRLFSEPRAAGVDRRPREPASMRMGSVAFEGDAPRYWSPWRRDMRPVRGIFHACYTFAFRAELLERIARAARASGGRVGHLRLRPGGVRRLRLESAKERRWLARSLFDLDDAARRGLLTTAGQRLVSEMRSVPREPEADLIKRGSRVPPRKLPIQPNGS